MIQKCYASRHSVPQAPTSLLAFSLFQSPRYERICRFIILLCSIAFLQLLHLEKAFEIIAPESINPNEFMCAIGPAPLAFVPTDKKVLYDRWFIGVHPKSFPITEPYHIPNLISTLRNKYMSEDGELIRIIVFIYPTSQTSFKNLMDVIDELNQVPNLRYTLDFSNTGDYILSNLALFNKYRANREFQE